MTYRPAIFTEFGLQLLGIDIQPPPPDPDTWDRLVADCMHCVHPVRQMFQERGGVEVQTLDLIHKACAAALLANLLRDVRVDMIEHNRLYLPADVATKHRLDIPLMRKALSLDTDRGCNGDQRDGSCDCALIPRAGMLALRKPYAAAMRDLVARTQALFQESHSPWQGLSPDINRQLHRMILEGQATLSLIARHKYDTLTRRPNLSGISRACIEIRLRWPW